MNRTRLACLLLTPAALVLTSLAAAAEPYRETFDQSYNLAPGGRVALTNVNGDVQVGVWDQPTVRVQAVKEADTPEGLEKLRIEVAASASAVEIQTRYPRHTDDHLSVAYTLTVPRDAALDTFELVNGGLSAGGVLGKVRARLVNGEARLAALAGDVDVHTVNGELSIELARLDPARQVELETVNGSVELRLPAAAGADVHAETVNGHLGNDFGIAVNKHEHVGADMIGAIGGGGASVKLRSVNGTIRLTKL